MALKKVRGNLERLFDKNLNDLVRGIRNHKENEAKFIGQCLEEIKEELRSDSIAVKANAVQKLTYLHMLGYDISWAAFNIIEVMSSTKFTFKRIGYLASSQCFSDSTEVLMLTTNMIRKDLNSHNQYESGVALTGLSCFISTDLARDLANDVMSLLTSTKPYLRKKGILLLYQVFLHFPDALRPAFPRLKEKLEDPDPGVQSAAVSVVCELARKNPKNYLPLAPMFFKLMTSSTNNWMLIKIIKLFGALTPLEPRLGKKLIEPLTKIIHSTTAMSLLYECINTVIAVLISISSGLPNNNSSVQLCVQKLRILIEDSDQNLKYLGLLAMGKILTTNPKPVQAHKDLIMQCLDDKDESIRLRALDLLYGMVSKKNVMEIIKKLMVHMERAEGSHYRDQLLTKIIFICSQSNYQHITNFEWYVSVLVEIGSMEGNRRGDLVCDQLIDVAVRVPAVRGFAVAQMALLLENAEMLLVGSQASGSTAPQILLAAAWICGQFPQHLPDPKATLDAMLFSKLSYLPAEVQATYIQNVLKVFCFLVNRAEEEQDVESIPEICQAPLERLPELVASGDLEIQERAATTLELIRMVHEWTENRSQELGGEEERIGAFLTSVFAGELNPVAAKAQKKVPVPAGLDLDTWINEPLQAEDSSEEEAEEAYDVDREGAVRKDIFLSKANAEEERPSQRQEVSESELQKRRDARMVEIASNPHYLKDSPSSRPSSGMLVSDIPVAKLDLNVPLQIPGMVTSDRYLNATVETSTSKSKKKKKREKKSRKYTSGSDEDAAAVVEEVERPIVYAEPGEMPEGAALSDEEKLDHRPDTDPHKALNIDLETADSRPGRNVEQASPTAPTEEKKSKKKKKTKKDKTEAVETGDLLAMGDIVTNGVSEEKKKKKKDKSKKDKVKGAEEGGVEVKEKKKKKERRKEYEEAEGISTCAFEALNGDESSEGPSSPERPLAEDEELAMLYRVGPVPGNTEQVTLFLTLKNTSGSSFRDFRWRVEESSSLTPLYAVDAGLDATLDIPVTLASQRSYATKIPFKIGCVTQPVFIRGSLSCVGENSGRKELDFRAVFPVSAFFTDLSHTEPDVQAFTHLLTSGDMEAKSSISVDGVKVDSSSPAFESLVKRLCSTARLQLVETVPRTASLYASTIQGHPVCLLLKLHGETRVSVDGKSTDQQLLANLMDEIRGILAEG